MWWTYADYANISSILEIDLDVVDQNEKAFLVMAIVASVLTASIPSYHRLPFLDSLVFSRGIRTQKVEVIICLRCKALL